MIENLLKHGRISFFATSTDICKKIGDEYTKSSPDYKMDLLLDDNQLKSWNFILKKLDGKGFLMFNQRLNFVCLQTSMMTKILSLFIAPEAHIRRMQKTSPSLPHLSSRNAIVGISEATSRLRQMKSSDSFFFSLFAGEYHMIAH